MNIKKHWFFVILINVSILGAVAMLITGMAISNLYLAIAGFICVGAAGVFSVVFSIIVAIKNLSREEKQEAAEQLKRAKKTLSDMTRKQLFKFILLTIAIVLSLISAFVCGKLDLTVPMFISIGIFVGIGVAGAIISSKI